MILMTKVLARLMIKFRGDFEQLSDLVARTGIAGHWRELLNGHVQFRSDDGAALNWWPTTGTLNLQGNRDAACELAQSLAAHVADLGARPLAGLAFVRPPALGAPVRRILPRTRGAT